MSEEDLNPANTPVAPKKVGVVIGRFSGIHRFHVQELLGPALFECDEVLLVIGSAQDLSVKNPFSTPLRRLMIIRAIEDFEVEQSLEPGSLTKKVVFFDAPDRVDENSGWARAIANQAIAGEDMDNLNYSKLREVTLYGIRKDSSSFYLDFDAFRCMKRSLRPAREETAHLGATMIREAWYLGELARVESYLYPSTFEILQKNPPPSDLLARFLAENFNQLFTQRFPGYQLALAVTGGGMTCVNALFKNGGASDFLAEFYVPYSKDVFNEVLDGEKAVSAEAADAWSEEMRVRMYHHSPTKVISAAFTAKLTTSGEREGRSHEIYGSIRVDDVIVGTAHKTLDFAPRFSQEEVCSNLVLTSLLNIKIAENETPDDASTPTP